MMIAFEFRTYAMVNQMSQLPFPCPFFAPVYFPFNLVPLPFRYLTLLEPTTYASQSMSMAIVGNASSLLWVLGDLVYGLVFFIAASYWVKRR